MSTSSFEITFQDALNNLQSLDSKEKRQLAKKLVHFIKEHIPNNFTPWVSTTDPTETTRVIAMLNLVSKCVHIQDPIFSDDIKKHLRSLITNKKISSYLRIMYAQMLQDIDTLINFVRSESGGNVNALVALRQLEEKEALKRLFADKNLDPAIRIQSALELARLGEVTQEELIQVVDIVESLNSLSLPRALSVTKELAGIIEKSYPDLAVRIWEKLLLYQYISPSNAINIFKRLKSIDNLIKIVKSAHAFGLEGIRNPLMSKFQELSDNNINAAGEAVEALWDLKAASALREIVQDNSISLLLRERAAQYLEKINGAG